MQIWTVKETLEYSLELVRMYRERFNETPMSVMEFPIESPTYIKFLEYCLENDIKTNEELIRKYFNNLETLHINHGGKYF